MRSFLTVLTLLLAPVAALADAVSSAPPASDMLPAWVIELPDTVNEVLIADTSNATLHRFRHAGTRLDSLDRKYMSIGQNGAGKKRAWDKKTPLGTYFITERLDTSTLHDKYGAAAFVLDYPNAWDRYRERTGDGIWLHGVDPKQPDRPPLDTDGCLALKNDALLQIAPYLEPLVTPVIVADGLRWSSAAELEQTRRSLRTALEQWLQSLHDGDLQAYLALYSDDFRHLGMNKAEWGNYRMQVFASRPPPRIAIDNIMLLEDPVETDLYLSRFTQMIDSGEGTLNAWKRLYWRRLPGDRFEIVSEDSG